MKEIHANDTRMSVAKADERRMERLFMMMLAAIFILFLITYLPTVAVKSVSQDYTLFHFNNLRRTYFYSLTSATIIPPSMLWPTSSTGQPSSSILSFTVSVKRNIRYTKFHFMS